jgi:hypothetical protein
MASGHLCLNLSEKVNWHSFPAYGAALISGLRGSVDHVLTSPDMEIWDVVVFGENIRLVFSDYPAMVSLESKSDKGDSVLKKLCDELSARLK